MQSGQFALPYNIYVLLFGTYISIRIACGHLGVRQLRLFSFVSPALLLIQGILMSLFNADTVRFLYPLVTHLPLIIILVLREKRKWSIAAVSVAISYSICQMPRWIGLLLSLLHLSSSAFIVIHIACSHLLLLLLDRFCLSSIHEVICGPSHLLLSLGALPIIYYLYEYFMIYTHSRYIHLQFLSELLPTGLVIFFILFIIVYHRETEKRLQAEQQMHTLKISLIHAEQEMQNLRVIEEQTAIHRHDLRHHFSMLSGMLQAQKWEAAQEYIHAAQSGIDAILPERFCENETVNLLLSAYRSKAEKQNTLLNTNVSLPTKLDLPDTELCVLLSNGLENALTAVKSFAHDTPQTIEVFFRIRQKTLLLEIRNPYQTEIEIKEGLPLSPPGETHYGCRSIRSIVQNRQGVCTFSAEDGFFTLRIAIPLKTADY